MEEGSILIYGITISWSQYTVKDLGQLPLTEGDGKIFDTLLREDMRLP